MVCNRCILVVKNELENLGIRPETVTLGEVVLAREVSSEEKTAIEKALVPLGFELIDDKKSRLIERIKTLIIELIRDKNSELKVNLSDYLSQNLHHDYGYLSALFSEVEGQTIEKYFIAQKIERVKELLVYGELSLSEIADQLHYSSVAHLSAQFKKVTGLTAGHFKNIGEEKRRPLDSL